MNITESILQSYRICPRQAWMEANGIGGDKNNQKAVLDEANDCKAEQTLLECEAVVSQERPPQPRWVGGCTRCPYAECCYS